MHETAGCTNGSAKWNNCVGIRYNNAFAKYKTKADSINDCARIWDSYYKRIPDLQLAKKWTGNDRAREWLHTVLTHLSKS